MKNRILFLALGLLMIFPLHAQQIIRLGEAKASPRGPAPWHGERRRINDLIHTELDVVPHPDTHTLDGKAKLILTPHFYPTDSLTLDAKAMEIRALSVDGQKADYRYDGQQIHIRLPRTYRRGERYTVHIDYLARPDSVKSVKGNAITDNRGLYFIDAVEGEYPAQFWTQGEPESNSCWFPTTDSPNQKSTQKISITVPRHWVTLSNGTRIDSIFHADGTRTDVWALRKPHAPYLFFMAGGPFVKVHDSLGSLPVNYYVEPRYKDVAKQIFGRTPEMIRYFSTITGVPYPWPKYSQIVTRKFVSGAMENTTAVNHSDMAYQDADQLVDKNSWETVIAHELFHHWFGDLVTAESWAQITVNESFADYSEALWLEHTGGPDLRDQKVEQDRQLYFMVPGSDKKPLVRHHYHTPDDVFDIVSYQKGGAILHMLRTYVGDSAFFAGLHKYLTDNAYGTGEAERLRLAMEDVSGMDLTRFFKQWYYRPGHPKLDITYDYKYNLENKLDGSGTVTVHIRQKTEKPWEFPLMIDIYENGQYHRYPVRVDDSVENFTFPFQRRPDLVNVGARHVLLARINDHRPDETYYFQYFHARNFMDRKMGLDRAIENKSGKKAFAVIEAALDDPLYSLRIRAIKALDVKSPYFSHRVERKLKDMTLYDRKTLVQAVALAKLGELHKKKYLPLFRRMMTSRSRAIRQAAFIGLSETAPGLVEKIYNKLSPAEQEKLGEQMAGFYAKHQTPGKELFVARHLFREVNLIKMFTNKENNAFPDAVQWISSGDNVDANRLLADFIYRMAGKYNSYGLKGMALMMLRSYMNNQRKNKGTHHDRIMQYYKQTLDKIKALK